MATRKIRAQDFLSNLPLFQGLGGPELDRIAHATTQMHAPKGHTLFKQGDPCKGFHSVVYGRVKLMLRSALGDEKVVRIIGPGGSFGEALMFTGKPYIVTAQTLEDTMLLHIAKEALFTQLDQSPALSRKMIASLSQRLQRLMGDVESYSLRSGTQRVIGYLLKDAEEGSKQKVTLQASKAVIASRLNLTPEHFSRILRELSELELIEVKARQITILDTNRLIEYQG